MPCVVAIRSAKAITEELPEASTTSIGALARCSLPNSERDVQRLAKKFQLCIDIPMSEMTVGGKKMPFLKMSDWARFLADRNLLYRLCGLDSPNPERFRGVWRKFWKRYQSINGGHEVFEKERAGVDLGNVVGLMLHGDEGRSQKKGAMLVVSAHSVLGFGVRSSPLSKQDRYPQNLNYCESTWCTRFLLATVPRAAYADEDDLMQDILLHVSTDLLELYERGITTMDGEQVYFCPVSLMGDWPFIAKAGMLTRSFMNISKHSKANSASKGICHMCQADCPNWIWEDFESRVPPWLPSMNTLNPFKDDPALFMLPMDPADRTKYFAWDLFHCWHIGAGKKLMATAFCLLAFSDVYQGSVDTRIAATSSDFIAWCRSNKQRAYLRKISKEMLSYESSNSYPSGGWSKGQTTTVLTKWFIETCRVHMATVRTNGLLELAFQAAVGADIFLSGLYQFEAWIPANSGALLARHALEHLRLYGRGASLALQQGKCFFPLMPNHHRLHHLAWDLLEQSQRSEFCLNLLHCSTQPSEDFIGRPCRISRKVNVRDIVTRTLQRSLITVLAQYHKAGLIRDPPKANLGS